MDGFFIALFVREAVADGPTEKTEGSQNRAADPTRRKLRRRFMQCAFPRTRLLSMHLQMIRRKVAKHRSR